MSEQYNPYIKNVLRALQDSSYFQQFRSQPTFLQIYEGISKEESASYIQWLEKNQPDYLKDIDTFKVNDLIGKPRLHEFSQTGAISCITIRYVAIAAYIEQLFGRLDDTTVAEIGVGFGGQFLVLDRVHAMRAYHLFDLQPVLQLTTRYLEHHLLRSSYRLSTLNQCDGQQTYDLVISNYALSELPDSLIKMYIQKVLNKATAGYITTNDHERTISLLRQEAPRDDYAVLSLPKKDYVRNLEKLIVWGHKKQP
ncbi:MAG: putative sugar O-methyltransferase [Alphaproteobacteria bacterium GM202ARS2]|nr:putative sugar O-methyltransferase [Alphaproteobacteria bacterium GM202ARS2]